MVAKFMAGRPSSPSGAPMSQLLIQSPSAGPSLHHQHFISASTGVPPGVGTTSSGSPIHMSSGFQSLRNDDSYYRSPPPPSALGPQLSAQPSPTSAPGVIGGKFIFKSNVIQNHTEMSPPFLVMKPQPAASSTSDAFPTNGRVVLIPGRNYSPPPPSPIPQSNQVGGGGAPNTGKWIPPSQPQNLNGISNGNVNGGNSTTQNGRGNSNGAASGRLSVPGVGKMVPNNSASSSSKKDLFTQRKQREFIPDNKKDDNYWDRRRRNNEAAKRSREKRRFNDMILEQRVIELTKENHILKAQLDAIRDKYNIYGEELISLDQILNTMPTPDQVLSVNSQTGNLTIASGLTTTHFRTFQMNREAMAAGQLPANKKIKLSSPVKGEEDDVSPQRPISRHQIDNHHDRSPSKETAFYKHNSASPPVSQSVVRHLAGAPMVNKSPPSAAPNGLINYSLRDIYYNGSNSSSSSNQNASTSSPPIPSSRPLHPDSAPPPNLDFPFDYAANGGNNGEGPIKYEDPEEGPSRTPPYSHPPSSHHHHLMSPNIPSVHHSKPIDYNNNSSSGGNTNPSHHYYFDENRGRRRKWEESAQDEEEALALKQRQVRSQFSQLELILNLSAKREHDDDVELHHHNASSRDEEEPEPSSVDRESPVIAAKNHSNLLPLKLRHKNNFSASGNGVHVKQELMHHEHIMRSRVHHPGDDHEPYDEDEDVKSHVEDDINLEDEERVQRRVHCCIEVEKLPSEDEDDDKPSQSSENGPKPNNIQLKTQLARLENEVKNIKNMMYMNSNATAAAQ